MKFQEESTIPCGAGWLAASLAATSLLGAGVGQAHAAAIDVAIDEATEIIIDTTLTPDGIAVAASGSGAVDLTGPADSPATAGVLSVSGTVTDPIMRIVPLEELGGDLHFDVPAGAIGFTATANGATENPITAGTFTQADVIFTFSGSVGGSLIGMVDEVGEVSIPFSLDLTGATIEGGTAAFVDATVAAGPGGTFLITLPLDIELGAPLSLNGVDGGANVPVAISGNIVLQGVVPEPASLSMLAGLGLLLGRRRCRA